MLILQCVIVCVLLTVIIVPALFKNPIAQIMSYPKEIRERVESLPQYKDSISNTEKRHIIVKIAAVFIFANLLAILAYVSNARTFKTSFIHVFILFFVGNLYDLFVLDLGMFRHSKKVIIPGTEDMVEAYKNPRHHIVGAVKGIAIGTVVSLLSGGIIFLVNIL